MSKKHCWHEVMNVLVAKKGCKKHTEVLMEPIWLCCHCGYAKHKKTEKASGVCKYE